VYFVDLGQYISPLSSEPAYEQRRLSNVGGSNLDKLEGKESVKPPRIDKYCLVSRVVTPTNVRIAGLSSMLSPSD